MIFLIFDLARLGARQFVSSTHIQHTHVRITVFVLLDLPVWLGPARLLDVKMKNVSCLTAAIPAALVLLSESSIHY